MAFFQNSVINKYIANIDKQTLHNAYAKFRAHFHNATIQDNIRSSKEEQYQGEFLIDLFVNVLGYTKNPTPNFNLTTEYKNVKDSKKADGAIIINEIVKAVIELKGTNTTDLNKIEVQAFGYKNKQPECEYVITSNFEKLRFYVDNAIEYLEFNLFTLSEKEFELLYMCLSYDSIAKGLPKQIKDESVSQEALITKKLYQDYSVFKNELYHSLVKLNPQYEPLELFKKSQKLLDRFLFIFFAEDRQLLPTNLIFRINKEWQQLREMRIEVSLYDRYKIYFNDLDRGAKVSLPAFSQTASKQKEEFQIYAYNGGLFKTDDLLNDIKIDDGLLFSHTEKLSNYDFASEVDVNVLGHIFENSLNDVDEIKAQLEGQAVDKTKTKRKKDGVFYTPKYITKYIVDNTVGKLCIEKKEELKINEDDYKVDKKRTTKAKQALLNNLDAYRNWLLQLTICDPACGSGAFLNQALDFLITEHAYIDELQAKVLNVPMVLSDIEGSILENNLFGVDINEESVEIAKLSLWLRTAQPNRKLNDLTSNIKCGNSLIDDVKVAGDKAFNWEQEFPQVFQNTEFDKNYISVDKRLARKNVFVTKDNLGDYKDDSFGIYNEFHEPKLKYKTTKEKKHGFDVVIGNPPYVDNRGFNKAELAYLYDKYPNSFKKSGTEKFKTTKLNLIAPFIELNQLILKNKGLTSFIFHKNIFKTNSYTSIREFILREFNILLLTDWGAGQFQDVIAETATFVLKKERTLNSEIKVDFFKLSEKYLENYQSQNSFLLAYEYIFGLYANTKDREILEKIELNSTDLENFVNVNNGIVTGNDSMFLSFEKIGPTHKKAIRGKDIKKYSLLEEHEYVDYNKTKLLRARDENIFLSEEKLLMQMINIEFVLTYDNQQFYNLGTTYAITNKDSKKVNLKFLLCVLNSKLIRFYYLKKFTNESTLTNAISTQNLFNIPIKNTIISEQNQFAGKADLMLTLNKELQELSQKFQRTLQRKFELEDLPKKLENWYLLSYSDFIKELAKKKIKLSLSDEAEWEEYFNTEAKKALELKSKIDATDKEIDQMVYKLYNLTEEEIAIVEKS